MASFVSRLAGRVASSGAAAALVNANQPAAQARAPAQVAERAPQHNVPRKPMDEEWLLTEFDHETLLFNPFKPDEIECAITEVMANAIAAAPSPAAAARPSVWIEEVDTAAGACAVTATRRVSDAGTADTSEGAHADAVIEQVHLAGGRERSVAGGEEQAQLGALLNITSRLMRRPGFQREVVACMLEEEEVRELMLGLDANRQLDAYLQAVGIHTPGLLPPPAAAAVDAAMRSRGGSHTIGIEDDDENAVDKLLRAISAVLEKTNDALAGLGGWLRDRAADLGGLLASKLGLNREEQAAEEEDVAGHGAQGHARSGSTGRRAAGTMDTVLGAVMVVAVGVLCVLLTRRPVVRLAGAAAMAGAASRTFSTRR